MVSSAVPSSLLVILEISTAGRFASGFGSQADEYNEGDKGIEWELFTENPHMIPLLIEFYRNYLITGF